MKRKFINKKIKLKNYNLSYMIKNDDKFDTIIVKYSGYIHSNDEEYNNQSILDLFFKQVKRELYQKTTYLYLDSLFNHIKCSETGLISNHKAYFELTSTLHLKDKINRLEAEFIIDNLKNVDILNNNKYYVVKRTK